MSNTIGNFLRIAGLPSSQTLWQDFGTLKVYIPPAEYIFVLNLVAGRDKDMRDITALIQYLNIQNRQQVQDLLDLYISQEIQTFYHVPRLLDLLFLDTSVC